MPEIDIAEFFEHDPKLPLEAEVAPARDTANLTLHHVWYTSMNEQRVPARWSLPRGADGPYPAVVVLHGMHHSKEAPYVVAVSEMLAREGISTFAIDSPYHGEREKAGRNQRIQHFTGYTRRNAAVQAALDLRRAVDFLGSRPEVRADQLGFIGFSQGSILGTAFCATDRRVRCVVLFVGGGNFLRTYSPIDDQEKRRRAEQIAAVVDPIHHVGRISPRPLLMLNAKRDELVPPDTSRDLFEAAGEPKRIEWFDTSHSALPRDAFAIARDFLKKYLF